MMPNTAAVATPLPQAADAAKEILLTGGNAIDAAVAAMLAVAVAAQGQTGFGGYGGNFVAYLAEKKQVVAIDFDTRAPLAYRDELFADPKASMYGYLAVSVPGVLAGLGKALSEYGTMTFERVARPALLLAEEGSIVDAYTATHIQQFGEHADEVSMRTLFPSGKLPKAGDRWVQTRLGKLIREIGEKGIEAYYKGDIGKTIIRQIHDHGGILSEEDLAQYEPQVVEPLSIDYRGYQLYTPPPPSGGLSTLQILKVLEQFDLSKFEPFGAEYLHVFAEASRLCWADRTKALGDPDFVRADLDGLLSVANAKAKAERIRRGPVVSGKAMREQGPHTANICCVDSKRNVVSMTATQGFVFGSTCVIDAYGMVLGHGMSRFDYERGHPNAPAPRKRPQHNMAPTIVLKDGLPRATVGLPGGTKIVTVTAQLLANVIDFGKDAAGAVNAPRIHTEGDQPVSLSYGVSKEAEAELQRKGHKTVRGQKIGGPPTGIAGHANVISINPATNSPSAATQGEPGSALEI